MTEDVEIVDCPRCGNLNGLRERCGVCGGAGSIEQLVEKGHETLSSLRAKGEAGLRRNASPQRDDPHWAGNDPR